MTRRMKRIFFWHKVRKAFMSILLGLAFISIVALFATISSMELRDADLVSGAFRAVGYISMCGCSVVLYNVVDKIERKAMRDVQRRIRRV